MKVLQVHEFYQQPGGEDQVLAAEAALLTQHGHAVEQLLVHNDEVESYNRLALASSTIWNTASFAKVRWALRRHEVDVMHVHNTLPLLSPAVYYAAAAEGVPVIQTLHNYRLVCPAATLFRSGSTCVDCVGKSVAWPSVVHACYRQSRPATTAIAAMLAFHRAKGTWRERVHTYIALTSFARNMFVRGGLPASRIVVKPNFVDIEATSSEPFEGPNFALFIGRLAPEKGIETLLAAWRELGTTLPLKIAGDGPMAGEVAAAQSESISWLGHQTREEVLALMRAARLLVFPSTWFEGFPVTLAEALACGLPVVASDIGGLREIVDDGRTGRTFPAGDARGLAEVVRSVLERPGDLARMGQEARKVYEERYSPEVNYDQLLEIYRRAVVGNYQPGSKSSTVVETTVPRQG